MIYRVNAVPLQITTAFSTEIEQTLKMESQRPLKIKGILRMKNKAEGITLLDFKVYCKALVIKQWYWHRNIHKNQCNTLESPEINPHIQSINL